MKHSDDNDNERERDIINRLKCRCDIDKGALFLFHYVLKKE